MTNQDYNPVTNPKHYHRQGLDFQCVDISVAYPHPIAAAVEYVFRHQQKNGVEDLRKAAWWLGYAKQHPYAMPSTVITPTGEQTMMLLQLIQTTEGPEQRFWIGLLTGRILNQETLDNLHQATQDLIEQEQ